MNRVIHLFEDLEKGTRMNCPLKYLSRNPNAIHLLEANRDKIDLLRFSSNSSIFQWDYEFYRKRMDVHREELMKAVFHPKRLKRSLELGYDLFNNLE